MYKKTLLEQFLYISEKRAQAIVLRNQTDQISYAQLRAKVLAVAGFFKKIGINPGDRVALAVENSMDYVVAFYAVWMAGGVTVALNPQAKLYEIKNVLQHCVAKFLLIDKQNEANVKLLTELDVRLVTLFDNDLEDVYHWQHALECKPDNNWRDIKESSLAQIIYTSGTTGNPKGVMLSHSNLMCNVKDIIGYLKLTRKDSVLNVLPFHYCYGNSVLHSHVCVGASVVLANTMAFPQDTLEIIRQLSVTGFSGVPSTYSLFLTHSDWADNPPRLRYLTQAGGPMGKNLTEKLVKACDSSTKIFVMYGQTEATARICWLPPDLLHKKLGSVGISVASSKLEIRNLQGQKLAPYQVGEICINGPSVMQGYWGNPTATSQALVGGWLKTGDLGYLDDDGFLFIKGRNSDMIKVGAHRINPMELEEVINQLTFVRESAVFGVEDEVFGQKLRALVVINEASGNLMQLKKHCREYLPAHKIPKEITTVTLLPKTASGKIKRHQLIELLPD